MRVYSIAISCFIAGIFFGGAGAYFYSVAYWGKETAEGLAMIKEMEIAESGQQAFSAYKHEAPEIAIYALNQYLDMLKKAEEIGGNNPVFMTKNSINFNTMLAHARLAKIYAAAGQSDQSTRQIAEALKHADRDQKLKIFTNETMLAQLVVRMDKGAANDSALHKNKLQN